MHTLDLTAEKIRQIAELLPNCVTEAQGADGTVRQAIDFDQLRQELSDHIVEGQRNAIASTGRESGKQSLLQMPPSPRRSALP